MPRFKTISVIYMPKYKLYRKEQYAPTFYEQGKGIDPNGPVLEADRVDDIVYFFKAKSLMIEENPEEKAKIEHMYKTLDPKDYELRVLHVREHDNEFFDYRDFTYRVDKKILEEILC